MNKFLSKITGLFLVHPDEAPTPDGTPARDGFLKFLLKDASGRALVVFLAVSLAGFAFTAAVSILPLEILTIVCAYLTIRGIGLHHANWRKRLVEETRTDGYREGENLHARHAPMPHYGRIATVVVVALMGIAFGREIIDPVMRMVSAPDPEPVAAECISCAREDGSVYQLCDGSRFCPPEDGVRGSLCTVGVGDCRAFGYVDEASGERICSARPHPPSDEVCDGRDNDCDGVVDDGVCVPSESPGHSCRDLRDGESTVSVTIDSARLDELFGACSAGRRIAVWDQNGCLEYADAGATTLTFDGVDRSRASHLVMTVMCGGLYQAWPESFIGQPSGLYGFASVRLDGIELADSESLIARDPYSDPNRTAPSRIRAVVPLQPIFYGRMP